MIHNFLNFFFILSNVVLRDNICVHLFKSSLMYINKLDLEFPQDLLKLKPPELWRK